MKVRIQFKKTGCMKFIGHLDIMRFFQKAIKRADIDIAYSQGFNPHQIMSFASPLGVGLTSEGEYLDIEINTHIPSAKAVEILNAHMVDGMEVTQFRYLPDNAQNAMSSIHAAEYVIYSKEDATGTIFESTETLNKALEEFFAQDEITVTKETKKGETTFDLKPHVYNWEVTFCPDCNAVFEMIVASGSETNIKPDFVLSHLLRFHGQEDSLNKYQLHRMDLYTQINNEYVSLGDVGEDAES